MIAHENMSSNIDLISQNLTTNTQDSNQKYKLIMNKIKEKSIKNLQFSQFVKIYYAVVFLLKNLI